MDGEVYSQSRCLVSRAAHLYYLEGLSQGEIARRLGVSVASVSRLIRSARDEGLIRFAVAEPFASCLSLERDLAAAFGLQEVLVAPSCEGNPEATRRAVAVEAARLVQRLTTPLDILGIAWGGTVYQLIQYLNPCRKVHARFVAMHGSISCCGPELDPSSLVGRIAMAFGGRRYSMQLPGLQASESEIVALACDEQVRVVQQLYDEITISVSGVGSLHPEPRSRLVRSGYLNAAEVGELVASGAYGDLVLRFFDRDGNECDTSMRDRTLSIGLDQYRSIPRRLVAACGPEKAETLRAALRGGLLNLLVVDNHLARRMLAVA